MPEQILQPNSQLIIAVRSKRKGEEVMGISKPCGMCLQGINEVEMRFSRIHAILILRPDGTG